MNKKETPIILVTNDDSIYALGIHALVDVMKDYGDVIVVAPDKGNSAKSHAVTLEQPLYYKKTDERENVKYFACSGTPVDCVKMGMYMLQPIKPDFVVSGINHGSNASINLLYSGTMAGAVEGSINSIPSIGFSVTDHAEDLDFEVAKIFVRKIFEYVFTNGLTAGTCLNVNIPYLKLNQINGIKVCRQTKGLWNEEFDRRSHPHGKQYYWLTGQYINLEPDATDTDLWALDNNYVAVVPVKTDLTDYNEIKMLKKWNL